MRDLGGVLALVQPGDDQRGLGGVLGRHLDEGALFRGGDAILFVVERLLHARLGDRLGLRQGQGADPHQAEHPQFGPAQLRLVVLHELDQLRVGRIGRRRNRFGIEVDVVDRAVLLLQQCGEGRIGARRGQARHHPDRELLLGDFVAQGGLERGRRQVVLGQGVRIGPLVEGAGDRIEEGRELVKLARDEGRGGLDARAVDHLQDGLPVGQLLQHLLVDLVINRFLGGHRLARPLLQVLQLAVEDPLELDGRNLARSGRDHRVADMVLNDVLDAPHAEADDQKTHQDGRHLGFREGSECSHHGGSAPWPAWCGARV